MRFETQGSGKPLVLIPGLGCDSRVWKPVGDVLCDRFLVIHPRSWGQGSLRKAALGVSGVLQELGLGQAFVAGLSMGGYITFELLRHHPERVIAAALVDTTAFGDTPDRTTKRNRVLELIRQGRFDSVLDTYAGSVLAPHNARGPLRDLILDMGRRLGPSTFAADVAAIRDRGSYEDVLRSARVPLLFVSGQMDALTPPDLARSMASLAGDGRAATVPGAGHMTPIEAPAEVARVLREFFAAHGGEPEPEGDPS